MNLAIKTKIDNINFLLKGRGKTMNRIYHYCPDPTHPSLLMGKIKLKMIYMSWNKFCTMGHLILARWFYQKAWKFKSHTPSLMESTKPLRKYKEQIYGYLMDIEWLTSEGLLAILIPTEYRMSNCCYLPGGTLSEMDKRTMYHEEGETLGFVNSFFWSPSVICKSVKLIANKLFSNYENIWLSP